ncbi:MAG TPA: hypothetical protein PKH33_16025 [bacterium]|nr:hypothetical protein [bacterium]
MKSSRFAVALAFIAGYAMALTRAASFFGWGNGPEFGLGSAVLGKISFFGYPLPQVLGRAAGTLPMDTFAFASAVAASIVFAMSAVLIFAAVNKAAGEGFAGIAGGAVAAAAFCASPEIAAQFRTMSAGGWSVFIAAVSLAACMWAAREPGPRPLALLVFAAAAGSFHHGILPLLALGAALPTALRGRFGPAKPAYIAAAVFMALAALSPMIFAAFRPPIYVNWDAPLAPWLGYDAPIANPAPLIFRGVEASNFLYGGSSLLRLAFSSFPPIVALGAIGTALRRDRADASIPGLWAAAGIAAIAALASPENVREAHLALVATALVAAGSAGLAELVKLAAPRSSALKTAAVCAACAAVAAFPFAVNSNRLADMRHDGSAPFAETILKTARRDAVLIIDHKPDPLFSLEYFQGARNLRPDIVVVRPPFIINEPYRKSIRLLAAGQEIIPSEVHYKALLEQLAGIAPSTQKPSRVVRERLLDGLVSIMHETLLFMNYPARPVYYNKIEKLVTSRLYKLMQFHPEGFLFKLSSEPQLISMEELAALGKHPAAAGNAGSAIVSDFISETAQNFWSQKRIAPALELFRTCTSLHPRNIECGFFTGLILKQQGDYAESEKHFYQTLKLLDEKSMTGPTETIDMFMYERIYTELGMLDEAEKYRRLSQPGMPANIVPPVAPPR